VRAHTLDERSDLRSIVLSAARTNVSVAPEAVIDARSAFDQLPEFTA